MLGWKFAFLLQTRQITCTEISCSDAVGNWNFRKSVRILHRSDTNDTGASRSEGSLSSKPVASKTQELTFSEQFKHGEEYPLACHERTTSTRMTLDIVMVPAGSFRCFDVLMGAKPTDCQTTFAVVGGGGVGYALMWM